MVLPHRKLSSGFFILFIGSDPNILSSKYAAARNDSGINKRLLTKCAAPRHTASKSALGVFFCPKTPVEKNTPAVGVPSSDATFRNVSTNSKEK